MGSLGRPSFPTDPFNFIRIIVSNDVKSARIKMPEKFTEGHEVKLPETVTLNVPNGDKWQVELVDLKGAIWFDNGWMEFTENYKLRFGHLLMFEYEGLLKFRVHIYEPSGCEMIYPKKRDHQSAHNSTEIKAASSLDSCVKTDLDDSEAIESDGEACSSWGKDHEAEIKIDDEGECSRLKVVRNERKRALQEVKASFTSDKPFFMAYMTKYHIIGRCNVRIPVKFVKENWSGFKKGGRCVLMLGIDKRYKKWEVDLCSLSMRIPGWKIFMKDNDVSEDDICVFELINPYKNMLKVSIIRS